MSAGHIGGLHEPVQKLENTSISFPRLPQGKRNASESYTLRHVVASCISLATTLLCFASKVISRSFRCSSFPNRSRCAGLRFGDGIYSVKLIHQSKLFCLPQAKELACCYHYRCMVYSTGQIGIIGGMG